MFDSLKIFAFFAFVYAPFFFIPLVPTNSPYFTTVVPYYCQNIHPALPTPLRTYIRLCNAMPVERTLALIKPDAYPQHKDAILAKIHDTGFIVVQEKEAVLPLDVTRKFYEEHQGRSFYEDLTTWMSSKAVYALVLEREDAVKTWRGLLGPTNSEKARAEAPESVRALFGTDGSKNAGHGSDSVASAEREIGIIFE